MVQWLTVASVVLLLKITSAQNCPCGYGGLCMWYDNAWMEEPCHCEEFNPNGFSPRYQVDPGGKTCDKLVKHCDKPVCSENKTCIESLGMGMCKCDADGRILADCSVNKKEYLYDILVYYSTVQKSWSRSFYLVYSQIPMPSGRNEIIVTLEAPRKIRRFLSNAHEDNRNCPPVINCREFTAANSRYYDAKLCNLSGINPSVNCNEFELNYPVEIEHPNSIKAVSTYFFKVLGRLETFSVQASLDRVKYFDKKFKIFVDYDSEIIRCMRSLKAHGCSSDGNAPTIYERQANIILSASFVPHFSCKTMTADTSVWHVSTDYVNERLGHFTSEGEKKTFSPRSLDLGRYTIEIIGTLKGSAANYGGSETHTQHSYCYIDIVKGEVRFIIEGGDRTADCYSKLTLKGINNNLNYVTSDLDIFWSCRNGGAPCETRTGIGPHEWKLECSKNYTFVLKATDRASGKNGAATTDILSKPFSTSVQIRCTTCGPNYKINPEVHVSLSATETPSYGETMQWSAVDEEKEKLNLDDIKERSPKNVLKIRPHSLKTGKTYSFTAKTTRGLASLSIVMNEPPVGGTCVVVPNEGIRGLTKFNVTCTGWKDVDEPLKYELIDVYPDHTDLITSSSYGNLHGFIFFSENVRVRIIDRLQLAETFKLTVKLRLVKDPVALKERIELIEKLFQYKDYEDFLDEATIVSMLLEPYGHPKGFKLNIITKIDIFDSYDAFLYVERVAQIMLALFNKTELDEEDADMVKLGGSETISDFLDKSRHLIKMDELKMGVDNPSAFIIRDFLIIANLVCFYKYPDFNYTVDDIGLPQIHKRRHKRSMENVISGLNYLVDMASEIPEPDEEEPYEIMRGGLMIWSKVGSVKNLGPYLTGLGKRGKPTLQFSEKAIALYSNSTISVNLLVLGNDVLAWAETKATSLVAQFVLKKFIDNDLMNMVAPRGPFYVTLPMISEIDSVQINGTAVAAPTNASVREKDRSVSVHLVEVPAGSGVVEFGVDRKLLGKIKIDIRHLQRPSFELVSSLRPVAEEKLRVPYFNNDTRLESDLYIGILSVQNVPIDYSINVTVFRCLIWSQDDWRSDVCTFAGLETGGNHTTINCSCEHLSFFSAQTFLPKNTLVLTEDIDLFTSILDNFYVVGIVIVVLLLYIGLLLWGNIRDFSEKKETTAIHLEDNYPADNVPYVIAVYTSGRCASGTTSKVAIQIIGDQGTSRVHILKSSERRTLRTSIDDWFVMYTKKDLGTLKQLVLWHDNKGRSPDWFCMRVVVYDLTNRIQYLFPVEKWFQVTQDVENSQKTTVDAFVPEEAQRSRWVTFFGGHALSSMRDKHHWASIFIRHPRSLYTRAERATIAVGFLTVSMFASMLFFGYETLGPSDYSIFRFVWGDFISSMKSLISSALSTLAIVFLFHMSKRKIKGVIRELPDFSGKPKERVKLTARGKAIKFMTTLIKSRFVEPVPFKPVVNDPKKLETGTNVWLALAWIVSLSTIVTCSFFVILYGLKFGVKKSLVWMAAWMLTVSSDVLVLNPCHIIIGALLISYLFKTTSLEAFTMDVECDTKKAPFHRYKERLDNAIRVRTRPEYKPMLQKNLEVAGWKISIRRLRTELCFSSWILFFLGLSVSIIMHYFGVENIYFNNLQLKTLFGENSARLGINVDKIYTRIEFYNYLQYSNLPVLHRITWYNGRKLPVEGNENITNVTTFDAHTQVKGFVIDYSSKLIGVPRLRQQRLDVEETMTVPPFFLNWYPKSVYGALYHEDQKDYLPGWKDYDPGVREFKKKDLWWYMSQYKSKTEEFMGKSGVIYAGSGYPVNLHRTLANSTWKLIDLSSDDWIDNRTRSIFLEINLYNANTNLFTTIAVIAEALPNGLYSAKLVIETASILFALSKFELGILILVNIVTIVLFINVIDTLYYLSRKGFKNYLANWSGLNNLVLIAVGFCFISVFFTRFLYFVLFIDNIDAAPRDDYTSLYPAFKYDYFAHCLTGLFIISITSISATLIHRYIGYERFRKALAMAKTILITLFVLNVLFSYLVSLYCFVFGTLYIERLGILFTLKEVPPFIITNMYKDKRQQLIIVVGLAILVMFLFNKASQIWYYGIATRYLGREVFVLAQILTNKNPKLKKSQNELALKLKFEKQLARWRMRKKDRKKGRGGDGGTSRDWKSDVFNLWGDGESLESRLMYERRISRTSHFLNRL